MTKKSEKNTQEANKERKAFIKIERVEGSQLAVNAAGSNLDFVALLCAGVASVSEKIGMPVKLLTDLIAEAVKSTALKVSNKELDDALDVILKHVLGGK